MKKYNIAFAGFRHGHIYGLYDLVKKYNNINIAGAWEDDAESISEAQQNGVEFTYKTYEELLNDKRVDIVAIGNYYGARGEMVISALKAGKHVIADKPLCIKMEEAESAEKISREQNLKIGLMLDLRHNKNVLSAMRIIENGTIGKINNIYFGGQHPLMYGKRPQWYFEQGNHGGTINDIAIHGIDLVRRFTKSEIKEIKAVHCWNCFAAEKPEFHDSAQFMLELGSGAGVIADVSYCAPDTLGFSMPTYWEFKVWGTAGMLMFNANADGVEMYINGENKMLKMDGVNSESNYLDDFLHDIEADVFDNTDSLLMSTKAALAVQERAE
ncbi:MAG: Gfo/Idh/MocA family oxidoreductase [Clostridia bacterium]|nr:Gfo/Idh/MocA family oxidoreductase [Clostridia bacterium]